MAKIKVTLGREVHEYDCDEHTTILAQGLDQGIDLPFACMSGVCTSCRAKLIKGEVTIDPDIEEENGWTLTCQARPRSSFVELKID